jgi:serine/threonine protein kinase
MGWWEDESELYIAMEYLHLGDLGTLLYTTQQPLPEDDVQHITSQILEGLSLMHQNGFAHRDLKPQVCFHSCIIDYNDKSSQCNRTS